MDDGTLYVGETADNMTPSGSGMLITSDGEKMIGKFVNGFVRGMAMSDSSEIQSLGYIVDQKINGIGAVMHKSGWTMIGHYRNNELDGVGMYHSRDAQYIGEWKNNQEHGYGLYSSAETGTFMGRFKNGDVVGQVTETYQQSNIAKYKKAKQHGFVNLIGGTAAFSVGLIGGMVKYFVKSKKY